MCYVSRKELNNFYKTLYQKDFPNSTLSKWKKEGKIRIIPSEIRKNEFQYHLEDFKKIVTSDSYKNKIRSRKEKPENYIGKTKGFLFIERIVPKEEYKENYKGTLMYCKCLKCNRPDLIQVRFSYLTDNGNYNQNTCGCGRKERAFLASAREGIREDFLSKYSENFEYFLYLHKLLNQSTNGYYAKCPIEEYENAIDFLDNNEQFHKVYSFWKTKERNTTCYDWAKPSIDHIIPLSRGGQHSIDNLQVLTVFENLSKRDMTWEEWQAFKKSTNTTSDYYIDNILKL